MQEGISVVVNGTKTHFYGTVLLLLADTLAAHQIGGFKVGVSFALRKCHDCLATARDMSNKVCSYNRFTACTVKCLIFIYSSLRVILHFETPHHMIIIAVF